MERGLSRNELAAGAGVSLATMARLEGQRMVACHRATLHRIATTLADDPELVISALTIEDGAVQARTRPMPPSEPVSSWLCSRIFPARPDQVGAAREFLGRMLDGCPMVYEAQVICSELVTNAVQHSRSGLLGRHVTVRAEVREQDYVWLEVEDHGGTWIGVQQPADNNSECGRGLTVVAALSDYWDIRGDECRRMVCARIDWPDPGTERTP